MDWDDSGATPLKHWRSQRLGVWNAANYPTVASNLFLHGAKTPRISGIYWNDEILNHQVLSLFLGTLCHGTVAFLLTTIAVEAVGRPVGRPWRRPRTIRTMAATTGSLAKSLKQAHHFSDGMGMGQVWSGDPWIPDGTVNHPPVPWHWELMETETMTCPGTLVHNLVPNNLQVPTTIIGKHKWTFFSPGWTNIRFVWCIIGDISSDLWIFMIDMFDLCGVSIVLAQ